MKISKEKIELIMAMKELTVSAVAEACGISRQNLSTIRQRGTCTPATAGKIARGLGVNPAEIIEKEE